MIYGVGGSWVEGIEESEDCEESERSDPGMLKCVSLPSLEESLYFPSF